VAPECIAAIRENPCVESAAFPSVPQAMHPSRQVAGKVAAQQPVGDRHRADRVVGKISPLREQREVRDLDQARLVGRADVVTEDRSSTPRVFGGGGAWQFSG
jgi:hypothetical protein